MPNFHDFRKQPNQPTFADMKIKRLYINNYKSLVNFELVEPNSFSVFVGPRLRLLPRSRRRPPQLPKRQIFLG